MGRSLNTTVNDRLRPMLCRQDAGKGRCLQEQWDICQPREAAGQNLLPQNSANSKLTSNIDFRGNISIGDIGLNPTFFKVREKFWKYGHLVFFIVTS